MPSLSSSRNVSGMKSRGANESPRTLQPSAAFSSCRRTMYQFRFPAMRSEEHTSELQSLMRISYAVFCLKKKNKQKNTKDISTKTRTTTKKARDTLNHQSAKNI